MGADVHRGFVRVCQVHQVDVADDNAGEGQQGVIGVGTQNAQTCDEVKGGYRLKCLVQKQMRYDRMQGVIRLSGLLYEQYTECFV